jgi:hypothetical protein
MEENVQFETTDIRKSKVKKGRFGMNWKSILTALVIVAIGIMLLTTEGGKEFAGNAFEFLSSGVGNALSGLFSQGFDWGQSMLPEGEQFMISTEMPKDVFYNQKYSVVNTSLSAEGLCDIGVQVGDITVKPSRQCSVEMEDMKGEFEYTAAGTVMFEGEVSSLVINGNTYTSEKAVQTSIELLPDEYMLVGLVQKQIVIPSASGKINRISAAGSVKSTEELDSETVVIGGFVGFIKLENSNINLQGLAVSVEGTGPHSSFSW